MVIFKRIFILLAISFSSSSFSLDIDLMNAPIGDFIRISQDNLPYTVAYDDSSNKLVSFKARVSPANYQSFFESIIQSFGYSLTGSGDVKYLSVVNKDELIPNSSVCFLENSDSNLVMTSLDALLKPYGRKVVLTSIDGLNAVSISGDSTLFPIFNRMCKRFDVALKQIKVEAVLVETSYTHLKSLGIDFNASGSLGSIAVGAASSTAGSLAISLTKGDFSGFLDALESDSNMSVLSKPNVSLRSGTTAKIQVGSNVPLLTGSVRQEDGQLYQSITRADVGLILNVTARSFGQKISLDLQQDISDVAKSAEASDLVFNKKSISTSLDVSPGEVISIGGLLSDKTSSSNQSVPFVSSIPLIGSLFGHDSDSSEKSVIALFVTASFK